MFHVNTAFSFPHENLLSDRGFAMGISSVTPAAATLTDLTREHHLQLQGAAGCELEVHFEVLLDLPRWLGLLLPRFLHLLALPDNWDSYSSRRIDQRRVGHAIDLLEEVMEQHVPVPTIVPTHDGGLQLEWHQGQIDLEVEILSAVKIAVYFADLRTGTSWEKQLTTSFDLRTLKEALQLVAERAPAVGSSC